MPKVRAIFLRLRATKIRCRRKISFISSHHLHFECVSPFQSLLVSFLEWPRSIETISILLYFRAMQFHQIPSVFCISDKFGLCPRLAKCPSIYLFRVSQRQCSIGFNFSSNQRRIPFHNMRYSSAREVSYRHRLRKWNIDALLGTVVATAAYYWLACESLSFALLRIVCAFVFEAKRRNRTCTLFHDSR